jgi:hypothetical protein
MKKTGGTVVTNDQGGSLELIRPAMQCHISPQKPQKTKLPNAIISPACSISFRLPVVLSPRQRCRRKTNRKRLKNGHRITRVIWQRTLCRLAIETLVT